MKKKPESGKSINSKVRKNLIFKIIELETEDASKDKRAKYSEMVEKIMEMIETEVDKCI